MSSLPPLLLLTAPAFQTLYFKKDDIDTMISVSLSTMFNDPKFGNLDYIEDKNLYDMMQDDATFPINYHELIKNLNEKVWTYFTFVFEYFD